MSLRWSFPPQCGSMTWKFHSTRRKKHCQYNYTQAWPAVDVSRYFFFWISLRFYKLGSPFIRPFSLKPCDRSDCMATNDAVEVAVTVCVCQWLTNYKYWRRWRRICSIFEIINPIGDLKIALIWKRFIISHKVFSKTPKTSLFQNFQH